MHGVGIPMMRTPIEMPPPHREVRRGYSCGLWRGLKGGEEGKSTWAKAPGVSQVSTVWGMRIIPANIYGVFTIFLVYAVIRLAGSGWVRKLFLELIAF